MGPQGTARGNRRTQIEDAVPVATGGSEVDLIDLLSVECLDRNMFRGFCHAGAPLRAFGGQVAAQALTAAGRTVDAARSVHSLHGYFLRPGDPRCPIVYLVERPRDGRSYVSRRVTAVQNGLAIFTLQASFKLPEDSDSRQPSMPPAEPPDTLDENTVPMRGAMSMRFDPASGPVGQDEGITEQRVWSKSSRPLPDDPLPHVCALAYCSDLTLASTASLGSEPPRQLTQDPPRTFRASLDHAMWFHRPFRADDWLLFVQRSPSAADGRAFTMGDFWTRDGTLIASVVQEIVLRQMRGSGMGAVDASGDVTIDSSGDL